MEPKNIIIAKWRNNVKIQLIHIMSSQFEMMAPIEYIPAMNEENTKQNTGGHSSTENEKNWIEQNWSKFELSEHLKILCVEL